MPSTNRRTRPPTNALRFKRQLLRWFRQTARSLPWRGTRDAYEVVVSEFMLQQTQVRRVSNFYHRFLKRFPTVHDLARARPSQVREAWEGLGYYRRAYNLQRLARSVVAEHDGAVPSNIDDLRRLPGVGRYTAGAVACFAYERPVPAVDTNVRRVLSRVFRPRRRPGAAAENALWDLAERIVPINGRTAWEFNQALMDLGSQLCTPRAPKCHACPVETACRSARRPRG